jgi:type II secretory pathway predicted ATPase ExeA
MTGMDADTRWVLLLGPEGSGKSTVIRALLEELRLAAATVAVLDARKTAHIDQLVGGLRDQLGLPRKRKIFGHDHSVSDIAGSQSARRTALVVVVDDADALSAASLKWLAGLAASTSRTDNARYVVLAGTPALEKSARRAWARAGSNRAFVRSMLRPMTSAEVYRYVDQWLASSCDARVKFSEAAIQGLEMYSKGRPGLISELCARVVTLPATRLTNQVSGDAVVHTAERLGLLAAPGFSVEPGSEVERGSRRHVARWVALVISTATIAGLLVYFGPGLISVGSRLFVTSATWLGLSGPSDRSSSEITRSRREGAPRQPSGTTGRAAVSVVPTAPSSSHREPRPAEKSQRKVVGEPSAQQIDALMTSARDGEVDELRRLLAGGVSPNVRDLNGFTPLMIAVVNDRAPAANVLLERGAEVNARTRGGLTALMLGIIYDRPDAVTLLLMRGADINAQSGAGWTALSFAAWKGDAALVRTLLSHGAKPTVIDKQGWRPLDYAPPKLTPTDTGPRVDAERGSSEAVPNPAETR